MSLTGNSNEQFFGEPSPYNDLFKELYSPIAEFDETTMFAPSFTHEGKGSAPFIPVISVEQPIDNPPPKRQRVKKDKALTLSGEIQRQKDILAELDQDLEEENSRYYKLIGSLEYASKEYRALYDKQKLIRNRYSAAKSRAFKNLTLLEKKQETTEIPVLQAKIAELTQNTARDKQTINYLLAENASLKDQLLKISELYCGLIGSQSTPDIRQNSSATYSPLHRNTFELNIRYSSEDISCSEVFSQEEVGQKRSYPSKEK